MTPLLNGIGNIRLDHQRFEKLMSEYPLLRNCNGEALPDREHVTVAFQCAGHAYLANLRRVASNLAKSILNSPDVPDDLVCPTAIVDAQIALELNQIAYASEVVRRIVTLPQWVNTGEELRNAFALLNTRINMKMQPNTRFPELNGKKLEDIEWLGLRLESGIRDGSFGVVVKPLFELRKQARKEVLVEIDMTIGELYFRGFENLDIAEDLYSNALNLCCSTELMNLDFFRPVIKLNYELGSVHLCNNKPNCAFYCLLMGIPAAAHTPEAWMRLAQAAILCVNAEQIFQRETAPEIAAFKRACVDFYELEINRKVANEAIKEEVFKKEYNGHIQDKPEPTYSFAFDCITRACRIVKERTREWTYLHFDLMSMYIFLTLELSSVKSAENCLKDISKLPNNTIVNRNVSATFMAKVLVMQNRPLEAVEALNSIVYPSEEGRRLKINRANGYLQNRDAEDAESCYDNLFAFMPVEAMRLKFVYNNAGAAKLQADVVVCGAGLAGLSVAHGLSKRGVGVCVFDKDCIGGGATSKCMGLVTSPSFWGDAGLRKIVKGSMDLYEELAKKHKFVHSKCGRVYLASSDPQFMNMRRVYSRAILTNSHAELIDDPSEMLARWPMIESEDVRIAMFSPDDVVLDTGGLCRALAAEIKENGGKIYENATVHKVLVGEGQKVYAVATDEGLVETDVFVNAAGIWANMLKIKKLGQPTSIRMASYPCTYSFLSTTKLPNSNISEMTPVIVDLDQSIFLRATDYMTIVGGFHEDDVQSLSQPNAIQDEWCIPPPDWDRFYPVLRRTLARCPPLGQLDHGELVGSAEIYTPDMMPLVGESDQINGYFILNGFNGKGLPWAGGLGKVLAEWITEKRPKSDIHKVDMTRFLELHSNPQYLHERVMEVASNTFKVVHHSHQCHTARNLRMSSIYHQLRNAGAVFGEIMGYERPLWFTPNTDPTRNSLFVGQDPLNSKPDWFQYVAKEYEACRERVGLIDMTSFAKFEIGGPGVVEFLQKICSGNIDKPIGTTIYTGMQNDDGGYVTDCTMSRLSEDKYFIVAPTIQQLRAPIWIKKWIKEWNANVYINDVTAMYTALNVVGPASRYLMQDVTGQQMNQTNFPTFSCKEVNIGMATGVRAISVTHCGELGWVLYIPNEVAQNVYEHLISAGQEYSLMHAGYYTLRHLRIEKFYVYWGQDINSLVTPVECGRAFRVDFDKDFIGKKALLDQMEKGVNKRFVQVLIDKHDSETDPWPQGNEIIYRNGIPAGSTTSAAYGFTLGCQVCIGYIENEEFGVSNEYVNSGKYEVDIANKKFPVRVNLHSPSLPMVSSEHPMHYRPTQ